MQANKAIANLVDTATSAETPDESLYKALSEMILSRADLPQQAIRCFQKKLSTKNRKVLMLTIDLIEYCAYACGLQFHNQLSTKDFLMLFGTQLNAKDIDEDVKKRMLCLLKCLGNLLQKDLHTMFFQFEQSVRNQGMIIPNNYNSRYSNVQQVRPGGSASSQNTGGTGGGASSSSFGYDVPAGLSTGKYAKVMKNLEDIQQKTVFINEIFDQTDPRQNIQNNDVAMDLMTILQNNEENLRTLISTCDDESVMMFLINLNDDIVKSKQRFEYLRAHKKPPPFRGQEVEAEILKQIDQVERMSHKQEDPDIFKQFEGFGFGESSSFAPPPGSENQFGPTTIKQAPTQAPPPPPKQQVIDLLGSDDPVPVANPAPTNKPPSNLPTELFFGASINTTTNLNSINNPLAPAPPITNSNNLINAFPTGLTIPTSTAGPINPTSFPQTTSNTPNYGQPTGINSISPPTGINPNVNKPQYDQYSVLEQMGGGGGIPNYSNPMMGMSQGGMNPMMGNGMGMNPMMGGGMNPMMGGGMNPMMGGGGNPMMGGGINPMMGGGGMNPMMGGGMNPNGMGGSGVMMMGGGAAPPMYTSGQQPSFNPSNNYVPPNNNNYKPSPPPPISGGPAPFEELDQMFGLKKNNNPNSSNTYNKGSQPNNTQTKPQNPNAFNDLL